MYSTILTQYTVIWIHSLYIFTKFGGGGLCRWRFNLAKLWKAIYITHNQTIFVHENFFKSFSGYTIFLPLLRRMKSAWGWRKAALSLIGFEPWPRLARASAPSSGPPTEPSSSTSLPGSRTGTGLSSRSWTRPSAWRPPWTKTTIRGFGLIWRRWLTSRSTRTTSSRIFWMFHVPGLHRQVTFSFLF